jgi:hypothetical protein
MPSGDRARPAERDPGGFAPSGASGGRPAASGGNSPSRVSPDSYQFGDSSARPRDGRPTTGFAARRTSPLPSGGVGGGGAWSDYYPWYGSGLNWSYSPYGYAYPYGASRWTWGRYGMWYDPYDPFGYSGNYRPEYGYIPGYGYSGVSTSGYGYGGYESSSSTGAPAREATGSVRVRVTPRQGKVYVDGTLMGTVDDFDGLRDHLATTAGAHEIEIRADGYQALRLPVHVEEDKTVTVRGSLKKN